MPDPRRAQGSGQSLWRLQGWPSVLSIKPRFAISDIVPFGAAGVKEKTPETTGFCGVCGVGRGGGALAARQIELGKTTTSS